MPIQEENYSNNQIDLIKSGETTFTGWSDWNEGGTDYIRLTVYDDRTDGFIGRYYSNKTSPDGSLPEIEVYTDNDQLSVKPNEILERNYVAGGDYQLQFDFFRDSFKSMSSTMSFSDAKFVITEIASSRREIRVIARNDGVDDIPYTEQFINEFEAQLGSVDSNTYTYDWVVAFDREKSISINNYTFDRVTGNKVTLILRLDKPIPAQFVRLDKIDIVKEVINTQTQKILYVSNITTTFAGSGLTPDPSVWVEEVIYETDEAENYHQLLESASFTENTLDDIHRKQSEDINLKIDFSEFGNHTVFGSAAKKLENFKTKVGKIQGYHNDISMSLYVTGSATGSYLPNKRKNAFAEIKKITDKFTPYEKFLYYDNQSLSTASAPGLGLNYASSIPVNSLGGYTTLQHQDGFRVVHKHEPSTNQYVNLFTAKYFAHEAPFHHYTGSIYLSFLLKADTTISSTGGSGGANAQFQWENSNKGDYPTGKPRVPKEAMYQNAIQKPNVTGSKYQRYILEVSQSHWRPTGSAIVDGIGMIDPTWATQASNWTGNEGTYYQILSSSQQVADASNSASLSASSNVSYPIELDDTYSFLGSQLTGSNIPFTGSILPSGELFRIYWKAHDYSNTTATSSFITDVKITLNNPTNAYPFSFIYPTGSSEFDTWYTKMHASASTFDENNINSLINNLPEKLTSDSDDIKTFTNMWGEHFDSVRNYIDTYKTFYNRNYKDVDSVPSNLLPILGDNLGWELINPFSSSLSTYFSNLTGSRAGGGHVGGSTSTQDITNNTWRKIINNLIYVYKTKGTQNSLRALLNIYGYPPDLISVNEYGGSLEEHNPVIIDDTYTTYNAGLERATGNVSFIKETILYKMMNFYGDSSRSLQFDYFKNNADGKHLEFNMVPNRTSTSMSIIESSGSGNHLAWALHYEPEGSNPNRGRLVARYNTSTNQTAIHTIYDNNAGQTNAYTASTDYFDIGNNRMFNVHLDHATDNPVIYVLSKKDDKINLFLTASLDASTITTSHAAYNVSTASAHAINKTSSSVLYVGREFKGQLADFRMWKSSLSASKMKQHTFNPPTVVGNDVNSLENELIYNYRLISQPSGSTVTTVDTNPNYIKDFTKVQSFTANEMTSVDKIIDVYKFVPRTDGYSHKNDNMITVDMDRGHMTNELSPTKKSFISNSSKLSNKQRKLSSVVDFTRSPSDKVDSYINQVLADKDISEYFAKWSDLYEPFYKDLDDLREKIMSGVSIDINKYIDTQARLFNPFILEAIQAVLPARTLFEKGVVIKQNILERTKIEYKEAGLTHIPIYTGDITDMWNLDTSVYLESPLGILDDKPDLGMSFMSHPTGEMTTEELFDYSFNYLPIYQSNNIKLYEEVIDYNIDFIKLINSNDISIINQEENFNMNILNPIQSNVIDIYKDFVNWNIEYKDITTSILSEHLGKTKYYDFSMENVNGLINSNIINVYEDFINYNINYLEIYNTNIIDWKYQSFLMNYLEIMTSNIPDIKYKEFTIIDLIIHDFSIDEWEYQSFGMSYLSLYNSNDLIILDNSSISIDYLNIYLADKLERWPFESLSVVNLKVYESILGNWPFQSFGMEFVSLKETSILEWPFEEFNIEYKKIKNMDISDWPYQSLGMTYENVYETDVQSWPYEQFNMKYIEMIDITTTDVQDLLWVNPKQSPLKNWGTDLSDTWIMNMASPGTDGTYNTGYYSDKVINYMIGDMEYASGSKKYKLCPPESSIQLTDPRRLCEDISECEATDWRCHVNRFIYDDGVNQDIYQSYFGDAGAGSNKPIKGRPIGKTTFIATASNGDLIYPVNHYRNYHTSKDQLRHLYYRKTPENIIVIDDNNNFHSSSHGASVQFKNDLYPKVPVYTLAVEGADTENILKVEKTKDRPLNVSGKSNPSKINDDSDVDSSTEGPSSKGSL